MASTLRVLAFGPVRSRIGTEHLEIACADAISATELWSRVLARHPELEPLRATIRLARGGEFLAADALLGPGDEIALIPPVSGG
jgi:molybdopterin synthase catalytic subunit/molybdopterin synthase sulfur carrier subunit